MERVKLRPLMAIIIRGDGCRAQNRVVWSFMETLAQRSVAVYLVLFFGTEFIRLRYVIVLATRQQRSVLGPDGYLERRWFLISNRAGVKWR